MASYYNFCEKVIFTASYFYLELLACSSMGSYQEMTNATSKMHHPINGAQFILKEMQSYGLEFLEFLQLSS